MINIEKEIELFWERCHTENIVESISGFYENDEYFTTYEKTIEFLKLKKYIKPRLKVLEVGVGEGHVTKGLFEADLIVSGLDISDTALKNVSKYCNRVYNTGMLKLLPDDHFDIIICNRVIQHVPTDLLYVELKHLIRSLSPTGIFALQFVSNNFWKDTGNDIMSMKNIASGTCCRSPKYLEEMVYTLDGICKLVYSDSISSGDVHGCHVFHIGKR